jgi:outer membrane protein OmpU
MQHRLLLGSTALVSAGLLMSGGAQAQETTQVGGIEVVLGGYTEWGVEGATEDTLNNNDNNRNYLFFMDNEVFVNAYGVTERGLQYGSEIELEAGSSEGNDSDATVDEVTLFFSGNFGRVELGREDGAEDVMSIGGEDAQAGTGGIDGDTNNLITFEITDTGDSNKATYFTPRVLGFQLGASWTPDNGDGIDDDSDGEQENNIGAGVNWVGALGPLDLTVAGAGIKGENEGDGDDLESWEAGALLGFGGFTAGVKVGQETDFNEGDFLNAGLKYGFGAANVSVGYVYFDDDDGEETMLFAVSGDVGLMPGVTLKGDVTYNDEDTGANCDDGVCEDTDETVAGVLSIQLDY